MFRSIQMDRNNMRHLPDIYYHQSFLALADIIGFHAAFTFVNAMPQSDRFYIPKKFVADHRISLTVGDDNFRKLIDAFGGCHILIPKSPEVSSKKHRIIGVLMEGNLSQQAIAQRFNVTERYVRKIFAELRDIGVGRPETPDTRHPQISPELLRILGWNADSPESLIANCNEQTAARVATKLNLPQEKCSSVRSLINSILKDTPLTKRAISCLSASNQIAYRENPVQFLAKLRAAAEPNGHAILQKDTVK
ncbi:hypothetical protein TH30_21370 [Thalassospira profundimaris]|uniref:Mor transcription activator domain-containing protein n=2 Tax=Thalassospiraceae TaxID=2844866 RepID=A0A367WL54_9PROT|nr:hypothetical protein TH30_21370 [Thalassospira profundimaris]